MKLSLPPQLLGIPAPTLEPVPAAQPEHSSAPVVEPGTDATDDLPPVLDEMIQSQPEIQPTPPPAPEPAPPEPTAPPVTTPPAKPRPRLLLAGLVGLATLGLSLTIALATTGRKPAPGGVYVATPTANHPAHQPARNSGYLWE